MKYTKKVLLLLVAAVLLLGLTTFSAFAASRKKINSVNIKITANIQPDTKYGDEQIDVEVRGGKCSFDNYEIENFGFIWEADDVPELTLYFTADEGYYFALAKASSIKMTGASYVSASKRDSSETLIIKVKLPSLAETVGDDIQVRLYDSGYAVWNEARGAGSYELRLYRNGVGVGATLQSTTETHYDYRSVMNRPGSYTVKVRAVNYLVPDNKGEWSELSELTLDQAMVDAIRNGEAGGLPAHYVGEWMMDDTGWWYRYNDGTYAQNIWVEIDDKWYFFAETGYMQTGWIEWNDKKYYCSENTGELLTSTTTPDGFLVGADGSRVNSR